MSKEERKFNSFEEMGKAMGRSPAEPTCRMCGKLLKDARFTLCYECNQKQREEQNRPFGQTEAVLPADYLQNGYFDSKGDLREELITIQALQCAQAFSSRAVGMTSGQLRRFYAHAKQAGRRLTYGEPFHAVRPAILEMRPLVADAVGRAKRNGKGDYNEFKRFIDRNVDLAAKDSDHFLKGFLPHFQYVVAFFTYLKPKD